MPIGANYNYIASAGTNNVVATGKAILHRIIIGKDVASAVVKVSDSPTSGSAAVKIQLTGSTLMTATGGFVDVQAVFNTGITLDLTNQTDVTVIWEPIA